MCFPLAGGDVGEAGAGNGLPPQRSAGGGAERSGGARDARWLTGTEDSSTRDAAGCSERVRAAAGRGARGSPAPVVCLLFLPSAATARWTTFLATQALLEGAEGFGSEGGGGVGGSLGQQGATGVGGDGEVRAFLGSHFSALHL